MKHKISANSKSVTNAGITSDYKQAIAEYIWNGFDAGASRVYIDYEANGLGALTSLSISDNGSGIKHDTIEFTFGTFLDSQKTKTFQRTSDVRKEKGASHLVSLLRKQHGTPHIKTTKTRKNISALLFSLRTLPILTYLSLHQLLMNRIQVPSFLFKTSKICQSSILLTHHSQNI